MKTGDVFPSKYLRGLDIEDREVQVTLSHIAMEDVAEGEKKPVAHFKGATKGVVLNKTNWDRLAHIAGTDESDDWSGLRVILYTELVTFAGKTGPSIRIKKPSQGTAQPTSPHSKEMDDEIPF